MSRYHFEVLTYPRKVLDNFSDEQVLFLTDIFPTGWAAIDWSHIKGGETVVTFGSGPVGLMAQKAAWIHGAHNVIAVDPVEDRLDLAKKTNKVITVNPQSTDVKEMVKGNDWRTRG